MEERRGGEKGTVVGKSRFPERVEHYWEIIQFTINETDKQPYSNEVNH